MKKLLSLILILFSVISLSGCDMAEKIFKLEEKTVYKTEYKDSVKLNPQNAEKNRYDYCFQSLDREQQRIYRTISKAALNMQEGWINLGKCRKNYITDIKLACEAFSYDCPEAFWFPNNYLTKSTESVKGREIRVAFSVDNGKYKNRYSVNPQQKKSMEKKLESRVSEILKDNPHSTVFETLVYFHDTVCKLAKYKEESDNPLIYTSYGALIEGKAVCEGYSRAMQLLCQRAGIPCGLITGESNGQSHMWNIVNAGDGFYHLDVTWDDLKIENEIAYFYFNLTDEQIKEDRIVYPELTQLKEINSKSKYNFLDFKCDRDYYNYYLYNDLIFDKDYRQKAALKILLAQEQNRYCEQFAIASEELSVKLQKNYEPFIRAIQKELKKQKGAKAPDIMGVSTLKNHIVVYWE